MVLLQLVSLELFLSFVVMLPVLLVILMLLMVEP